MSVEYELREISDGDMALVFGRDEEITVHDCKSLKRLEEDYDFIRTGN